MTALWHCLCLALLALAANVSGEVSCKDEHNNDVDWWFMVSLNNRQYIYVSSENSGSWQNSFEEIRRDYRSRAGRTLESLKRKEHLFMVAYNDVFTNGTTFNTKGAARGWIATDGRTGVWLVHSMPEFPAIDGEDYRNQPNPVHDMGHSFLCLTLTTDAVEQAAQMLQLYRPHFYHVRNTLYPGKFPQLRLALDPNSDPFDTEQDLQISTVKGQQFRLFGRHPKSKKELYAQIVAPALGVDLFVRTDRKAESEPLPNKCDHNKVYNVKEVVSPHGKFQSAAQNQAKWAVSVKTGVKLFWLWRVGGNDWTCIGDLNRDQAHQSRGGGAICLEDSAVADRFRELLSTYEECSCSTFPCEAKYD
ncbi:hypothetical protein KR093_010694 [Drosophila rubida]|uniref:Uncharacterized protein n=1 Tax=Drosophila rubida TaxID=30044 RepID=A0AAD4PPY9_9MUSC|nr:hypothetical protein KR093_010694 [Drosophila rubida]